MKQRYCYIVCKKYENFHKFFLKMKGTGGLARDYGRKKKDCGKLPVNNAQQLPQPFLFSFMQSQLGWLPSTAAH